MTKKDYILIARAMYEARPDRTDVARDGVWLECVSELAEALGKDNPRFDMPTFYTVCGVGHE